MINDPSFDGGIIIIVLFVIIKGTSTLFKILKSWNKLIKIKIPINEVLIYSIPSITHG